MTFFVTGGGYLTEYVKLTGNTATTVLDVPQSVTVASVICTETGGATPNLTIDVHDGTSSYHLRNAAAMTAKQTVTYAEPFTIPNGWVLRVTSSNASGQVDVFVNYASLSASSRI